MHRISGKMWAYLISFLGVAGIVLYSVWYTHHYNQSPWVAPAFQDSDVDVLPTLTCPRGEVQVANHWGYRLVGFCDDLASVGSSITVRTVDQDGTLNRRQFFEASTNPEAREELRVWIERLRQVIDQVPKDRLTRSLPNKST